jgi:2',3'-cyclic-nucleotide 2'-phosphodiesterase
MNILFIGDIFGRPGRNAVKKLLKKYREEHGIHLVIANCENMHHGNGVSEENISEMRQAGVDFFTSGNHVWKDKSIIPFMDSKKMPLVRPANYPPNVPGKGWQIIEGALKQRVLVINLMGRVFISQHLDCPFRTADRILKENSHEQLAAIFVDFHAEATSEKMALAHYLDGRVSAVIGTHTHVATADERIMEKGTAYQSDVGFVGPVDSVIGAEKTAIIQHFLTQMPMKIEVAPGGPTVFNAVKIEIDDGTRQATEILPIRHYLD